MVMHAPSARVHPRPTVDAVLHRASNTAWSVPIANLASIEPLRQTRSCGFGSVPAPRFDAMALT